MKTILHDSYIRAKNKSLSFLSKIQKNLNNFMLLIIKSYIKIEYKLQRLHHSIAEI